MGAPIGCAASGSRGVFRKKIEILMIWEAIPSVLRGQFYAKSNELIVIFFAYFSLRVFVYKYLILISISCSFLSFPDINFS